MKNNPWIVGGDEVSKEFVVSRFARPEDEQTNCAREWIMNGWFVKVFDSKESAQKAANKLNRY